MSITHRFVSAISDGADATLVQPSDWNDTHVSLYTAYLAPSPELGGCWARTQTLAGNAFLSPIALTNLDMMFWQFKPAVDGTIYAAFRIPATVAETPNAAIVLDWASSNTAASKQVAWSIAGKLVATSASYDLTFNTAETQSNASVSTTAYNRTETVIALTNTAVASTDGGKTLIVGITRKGSDGTNDTLTTLNALLSEVKLRIDVTQ